MAGNACQIRTIRKSFCANAFHIATERESVEAVTTGEGIIADTFHTIANAHILQIGTTIEFIIVNLIFTIGYHHGTQ